MHHAASGFVPTALPHLARVAATGRRVALRFELHGQSPSVRPAYLAVAAAADILRSTLLAESEHTALAAAHGPSAPRPFRFQHEYYDRCCAALYPDDIWLLAWRRMQRFDCTTAPLAAALPAVREFMCSLSPAWAFALLKTWLNAWSTSSRLHSQPILPCLFGCTNACDSLDHYISCPALWWVSGVASSCSLPSVPPPPAVRWSLASPSYPWARLAVATYLTYHTLKCSQTDSLLALLRAGRSPALHKFLCRTFQAALRQADLTAAR